MRRRRYAIAGVATLGVLFLAVTGATLVVNQAGAACAPSTSVGTPAATTQTAGQIVAYFEGQGLSANAAAGVTGNLQQESGLNPADPGGGLAQWTGGWFTAMSAYASSQGLTPSGIQGQLEYIVYDLRTNAESFYANSPNLLQAMNAAPDPATAAEMFETGYESCSGVTGWMSVTPGSLCNDPARKAYAVAALAAAGGSVPVSLGGCVQASGSGSDPIPGFTPGRDDMGVDACATPGMPIYAPAASTLVGVLQNWYSGQPLLLFQFVPPLAGAPTGYWYVAEQITPVTETIGTQFAAMQEVATFAPSGTCIEIGWGSPTSSSRTYAGQIGRAADANPPAGALTPEAESFKQAFSIPWVGQSP